jgi:hypothetical protein
MISHDGVIGLTEINGRIPTVDTKIEGLGLRTVHSHKSSIYCITSHHIQESSLIEEIMHFAPVIITRQRDIYTLYEGKTM